MEIEVCVTDIDEEFRFVWFGDGLANKGFEELFFAVGRVDVKCVR